MKPQRLVECGESKSEVIHVASGFALIQSAVSKLTTYHWRLLCFFSTSFFFLISHSTSGERNAVGVLDLSLMSDVHIYTNERPDRILKNYNMFVHLYAILELSKIENCLFMANSSSMG